MQRATLTLAVMLTVSAGVAAWTAPARVASSDSCGACHKDIYRMWRSSAHANAMEDPRFRAAHRDTESREGAAVARICLRCHAPLAEISRDTELALHSTWEGVSCEVCHSISAVDAVEGGFKITYDPGPVKRGPIEDAASSAHQVRFSELHTSALVCAGCHEYANLDGTKILSTYSEWSASSAAKDGRTCQSCHMYETAADVVDPKIRRVSKPVNLHEIPGGHSLEQLNKALSVRLEPVREGDEVRFKVRIANRGAGHAVPTGMPGRRVVLVVTSRAGAAAPQEARRTYEKSFVDTKGAAVTRDGAYFTKGVRMQSDTRIKADELREEVFRFAAPAAAGVTLEAKLVYEHNPTGTAEDARRITFFSETRFVPAR